jgi:hypothetical protein
MQCVAANNTNNTTTTSETSHIWHDTAPAAYNPKSASNAPRFTPPGLFQDLRVAATQAKHQVLGFGWFGE